VGTAFQGLDQAALVGRRQPVRHFGTAIAQGADHARLVLHQQNPLGADIHGEEIAAVHELPPMTHELPGSVVKIRAFARR
jgi:hypothetical protein